MRVPRIAIACALAAGLTLAACGKSSYEQVVLDEADGVKVTAENAGSDSTATTEGALTLEEGEVIVISPFTEKGSFHVTIATPDGKTTAYDDDASGKVLFTVDAEPGTYDVTTSGNGVTGWMTVFAESADELEEQNASLDDTLAEDGLDPDEVLGE